jgi:hypothetical protein
VNDDGKDREEIRKVQKYEFWWESHHPAQGRNVKEREAQVHMEVGQVPEALMSQ